MADKKSIGWKNVRQVLDEWPRPALIALVKDLYETSAENRDFLHARTHADEDDGATLETYRRKIVWEFFPSRGMGELNLAKARKAIRDYHRATGDLTGGIDLRLTYVENGTKFTCEFGDIDAPFYDSLMSVLNELVRMLVGEGPELYGRFRERILKVAALTDGLGWGYGDFVKDQVCYLEEMRGAKNTKIK